MLIAYADETGNTGDPRLRGSTDCYGIGCVLVDADQWPQAFDGLVALRRRLRSSFGVRMRDEIKANYLIRASGPLRDHNLAPAQRRLIYRAHLSSLHGLGCRAFAVVVDKAKAAVSGPACFQRAWTTLVERLERVSTAEKCTIMLVHDNGENDVLRRLVRKSRRHLIAPSVGGAGHRRLDAVRLVEDPVPRVSDQSYWIQVADMVAYAGWRAYYPPSRAVSGVVPGDMWDALGPAVHTPVNRVSGGVPGVVLRK